jgi:GTP cyclohydrolase I
MRWSPWPTAASRGFDLEQAERAIVDLLRAMGEDPETARLALTASRVAASFADFTRARCADPADLLLEAMSSADECGELVLMTGIAFRSLCEHHLLPFHGVVHVAYRPNARVAGLGTIVRVVAAVAARLQLQERMGAEIVDAIERGLSPRGVFVAVTSQHGCVRDRVIEQRDTELTTFASSGELSDPSARSECIAMVVSSLGRKAL